MTIDKQLIEELRKYSVPELCDGMDIYNTMDYTIKPMVTTQKIVGIARTINVPVGEGGAVAEFLVDVEEGEVIVIAGKGNCNSSYWGDHRSICAKLKKAEAVVIDGSFRDIEACEKVGFPIYAKAITPGTALKSGKGEVNVTVSCGGAIVNPGDIIVGDRNGVLVIPPNKVAETIEKTKRKIEAQEWTICEMERTGIVMPKVIYDKK